MQQENTISFYGNLGVNAETRTTTQHKRNYTVLSVAERVDGNAVVWHRCIAFGKSGKIAAKLQKGQRVRVAGTMHERNYIKDGQPQTTSYVRVRFVGRVEKKAAA